MSNNRSELFSQRSVSQFSGPFFHLPVEIPCINHVSLARSVLFFLCFVLPQLILETPINGHT